MRPDRSLVTILFTDIVSSTERVVEIGDRAWKDLLERHHAAVRGELARWGGREVNTAGDGFVATFDRPDHAIQCARTIREAVRELGLEVRSGLHMGQIESGTSIGGIAVHLAARVAAEGGAGDVLVSRSVHDAVEGGGFEFEDTGFHELKGVPGERRLFRVAAMPEGSAPLDRGWLARRWPARKEPDRRIWVGAAAGGALLLAGALAWSLRGPDGPPSPGMAAASTAAPAIAILPFSIQGEGLDMWHEGMVDVLSANLDGVPGLRAIDSRTVLARWREGVSGEETPDTRTALEIARRTGARYALIGSVVASGDGMRVLSELYDLENGRPLGQPSVDGAPDSIFALVDHLSMEILQPILEDELPDVDLARATTASLPALKAFLQGEVL